MKKALITGITGQDGSYLAEHLLSLGYKVYGVIRRTSTVNFDRIQHIVDDIELVNADLLDQFSLFEVLEHAKPDEVYNLAAQSFVPTSWNQPAFSEKPLRRCETVRSLDNDKLSGKLRSIRLFGNPVQS